MKSNLVAFLLLYAILVESCSNPHDRGTTMMNTGKYRQAITEFSKIDSTDSKFKTASQNIARCYLELAWQHRDSIAISLAYLDSVNLSYIDTQIDTAYSNYFFYFGQKLYETRQLKEAQTLFERVSAGTQLEAAKTYLTRLKPEIEKAERIARIKRLRSRIYGQWVLVRGSALLSGTMAITSSTIEISGNYMGDFFYRTYYIRSIDVSGNDEIELRYLSRERLNPDNPYIPLYQNYNFSATIRFHPNGLKMYISDYGNMALMNTYWAKP